MIASTSDSTKELINKKLMIFKLPQMDVKDMKCLFQWEKLETMFPIVGFFVLQILLGIVGSQIKMKKIFFLAKIFINLKRYHLQSNNLDKLIF